MCNRVVTRLHASRLRVDFPGLCQKTGTSLHFENVNWFDGDVGKPDFENVVWSVKYTKRENDYRGLPADKQLFAKFTLLTKSNRSDGTASSPQESELHACGSGHGTFLSVAKTEMNQGKPD